MGDKKGRWNPIATVLQSKKEDARPRTEGMAVCKQASFHSGGVKLRPANVNDDAQPTAEHRSVRGPRLCQNQNQDSDW